VSPDQALDFTTKDDVAAYAARAILDADTPRFLRIAGEVVTGRDIAQRMTTVSGETYRPLWVGSIASLGLMIGVAKLISPSHDVVFPAWQGMQYMRDMFTGEGKLSPLDNDRYPDVRWTSVSCIFR
jgi:hypothetical protein